MQTRLVYNLHDAPNEHPQIVIRRLSRELGFVLLCSVPQSIADAWWFWVEHDEPLEELLPDYVRIGSWLPIGTV